ncbi:hypothetical protein FO675_01585 [Riemerella anatipestifer]|uniref:hypothetical protein n=1 Tax=Riemerella anatipestifer TaxID=34085 RepID=UPI001AD6A14A|nr:hypothetical protein [Riemerella anatipestifer]MBO4233004.1 hypothetical protein [Riemerella anatipestifer]
MKSKVYFIIHFIIIFVVSINATIYSYYTIYKKDDENIIMVEKINSFVSEVSCNPYYKGYAIFTGTNTGYGFYGHGVATRKFFVVEVYDSEGFLIDKTSTFDFKNKSNLQRFDVLSSKIANSIAEIKKEESNVISNGSEMEFINFKSDYVKKNFKYIGLYQARKHQNCKYYVVKLCTLVPLDVWENENYHLTKNVAVYEKIRFEL